MRSMEELAALLGEWRIVKSIGKGSFGQVYEIMRENFGVQSRAALKVLSITKEIGEVENLLGLSGSGEVTDTYYKSIVENIVQEYQLMDLFKGNSYVVSCEDFQVYTYPDNSGWDILIRMELLTPLNIWLRQHPATLAETVRMGIHICRALELCAEQKVIHRDIKPANIFRSMHGNYKLGDFGIARVMEKSKGAMSSVGTPLYMAPEINSYNYDSTVDIYALGIVLYQLLNHNRIPFLPPYPQQLTQLDLEDALGKRNGGWQLTPPDEAPPALAQVILKACAFQPGERWQSAADLRRALETWSNPLVDNPYSDTLPSEPWPVAQPTIPPEPPSLSPVSQPDEKWLAAQKVLAQAQAQAQQLRQEIQELKQATDSFPNQIRQTELAKGLLSSGQAAEVTELIQQMRDNLTHLQSLVPVKEAQLRQAEQEVAQAERQVLLNAPTAQPVAPRTVPVNPAPPVAPRPVPVDPAPPVAHRTTPERGFGRCPACAAPLVSAGQFFCLSCGSRLLTAAQPLTGPAPTAAAPEPRTCPECGVTQNHGRFLCLNCGLPLTQLPEESPAPGSKPAASAPTPSQARSQTPDVDQDEGEHSEVTVAELRAKLAELRSQGVPPALLNMLEQQLNELDDTDTPPESQPELPPTPVQVTAVEADDEKDFQFSIENDRAILTGYLGNRDEVRIPATLGGRPLRRIDNKAFAEQHITSVQLPEGLWEIGPEAFDRCRELSCINLPDGLRRIEDSAFWGCRSLPSLLLPASLTHLGDSVFWSTVKLTSFRLAAGNTSFRVRDDVLFDKSGKVLLYYPGGKQDSAYRIPAGVTRLAPDAFCGNKQLKRVVMPDTLRELAKGSLSYCGGLTEISWSDSLEKIGSYAFSSCKSLSELELPQTLREISLGAFDSCSALNYVHIHDGVKEIGEGAFKSCPQLTLIASPFSFAARYGKNNKIRVKNRR